MLFEWILITFGLCAVNWNWVELLDAGVNKHLENGTAMLAALNEHCFTRTVPMARNENLIPF